MGAVNFSNEAVATSAAEAYDSLVAHARWERGRGGYTGTIAETRGFRMVSLRTGETPDTCEERVLDAALRNDRLPGAKWGEAACLDLGPDPEAAGRRRFAFFGWAAS